jgi:hypothetical protein
MIVLFFKSYDWLGPLEKKVSFAYILTDGYTPPLNNSQVIALILLLSVLEIWSGAEWKGQRK